MICKQQNSPVFLEIYLVKFQFFEIGINNPADVPGEEGIDDFVLPGLHFSWLGVSWLDASLLNSASKTKY